MIRLKLLQTNHVFSYHFKFYVPTEKIKEAQTQIESGETTIEGVEQDNGKVDGVSSSQQGVCLKGEAIATAMALYTHTSVGDDELSIKEGEILDIIEYSNNYWWMASNSFGETGLVPSYYEKLLSESKKKRQFL